MRRSCLAQIWAVSIWSVAAMIAPMTPAAQEVGVVQSQIVLLDPERLFEGTILGKKLAASVEAERLALIAMNRKLETELAAEEKALTEQRANTSPEAFRLLADAFDEKVQEIRRDSERRARDLERSRERAPIEFLRQVEPILIELMRDTGAAVVLDQRSTLLSADVVNITDLAILRIDKVFGEASAVPQIQDDPADDNEGNAQQDGSGLSTTTDD